MNALREARLRRDLNSVAGQVQSLLERMGEEGSERFETLRDRVSTAASSLAAGARDKFSSMDVRDSARQAARYADTYVRDNPWRAIGVGAVAGLLIGYLVSRR
jgi:ElaB/YqjD/DUF883 family membrane-anchored ribosome-binding protein